MQKKVLSGIVVEQKLIYSCHLDREVVVDFYVPINITNPGPRSLLFINDGQDLSKMAFASMVNDLLLSNQIEPLLCVGIHAGTPRTAEYGTAKYLDYHNRGSRAGAYTQFVLENLLPFVHTEYGIASFKQKAFAGFSLGGLSALDIAWNHPDIFSLGGIFSGSLWWRTKDLNDGYEEETDRIMHRQIKEGDYHPGQRFYFTTGSLDETADRNGNGIIDSIDDTLSLIKALQDKGYSDDEICYTNYEDGRHDVETWARAMPTFLLWGWGLK